MNSVGYLHSGVRLTFVSALLIAVFLLILLVAILVWRVRVLRSRVSLPLRVPKEPIFFKVEQAPTWRDFRAHRVAVSNQWQEDLKAASQVWTDHPYQALILVHGTFVGSDPLSVLEIVSQWFPQSRQHWVERLGRFIHGGTTRMTGDLGNFSAVYRGYLATALEMPVWPAVWSSANHHAARLIGARDLILQVLKICEQKQRPRQLMLWGHSHAGQLFALVTQIVFDKSKRESFKAILSAHQIGWNIPDEDLQKVQELKLDFVTFGTPVRYAFQLSHGWRLFSIVNDRSLAQNRPIEISGAFYTRDGDYIQHWARAGSDTTSVSVKLRNLNRDLDDFLDEGANLKLLECLAQENRALHAEATNAVIDYADVGGRGPNFLRTMFGHGTYTRLAHLPFTLRVLGELLGLSTQAQGLSGNPSGSKTVVT